MGRLWSGLNGKVRVSVASCPAPVGANNEREAPRERGAGRASAPPTRKLARWSRGSTVALVHVACLVVTFAGGACKKEETSHQRPVWSDLEHQSRAHPRTRPTASAPSTAVAPSGVRLAQPLEVEPLPDPCEVSDRVEKLVAGDEVLVSPIRVNFALAKVVTPERDGQVVVASRHGNEFLAAAESVYALRPNHRSKAQANCYGACKPASGWVPCLVTRVHGTEFVARDRDDRPLSLRQDEVVVFDPAVQKYVRDFFREAAYSRAFANQVARVGRPLRPSKYQPSKGEVVLADFGEKYLLARVTDVAGDTCQVQWLTSSMNPGVRRTAQVVPLPTAYDEPARPAPGDFVLAHARGQLASKVVPVTGEGDETPRQLPDELWAEWEPMRVEALYPDGRLLLSDAKRKQHEDATSKVIAFPSRARSPVPPASATAAHEQ